jgi:hypothetical protein
MWRDTRNGNDDIYGQRIDPAGVMLWTAGGVTVCAASGHQNRPRLLSDGSGGAIVTWFDKRSDSGDVYAQKVDAGGAVQWTLDGVAMCTAANRQNRPVIVSDNAGGAIIVWEDYRDGSQHDVYAQRVDASGNVLWDTDGVAVCTAPNSQTYPGGVADNAGGAVIAWADHRSGSNDDIYAQTVNHDGATGVSPTETLLQRFSSSYSESGVQISWTLTESPPGARFFIFRSEPSGGGFRELWNPEIARDGLCFVFIDLTCKPGIGYRYRVEMEDEGSKRILFETDPIYLRAVRSVLHQNVPNPFNPETTIDFVLEEPGEVSLRIVDVSGHVVRIIVEGSLEDGLHTELWNGCNQSGNPVASGVYFYQLTLNGDYRASRKMVLLK